MRRAAVFLLAALIGWIFCFLIFFLSFARLLDFTLPIWV